MTTYDDFGRAEAYRPPPLVCCDCGGEAEGNSGCNDGDICDACVAADEAAGGDT